jgi:Uma2 family endonuclease
MATGVTLRPISVDDYHRMGECDILGDDERIELLGGMLVAMPPIGEAHIFAHTRIVRYLIERYGDSVIVAGQAAIPLTRTDEPQPDISLFRPEAFHKPMSGWSDSDIVALIEISDSSLRRDLGPKMRAYARGLVSEYLVVDLRHRLIIRHHDPHGEAYGSIDRLEVGEVFTLRKVAGIQLEVGAFFPAER